MRASCAVGNVALGLHWALCFLHRRRHAERERSNAFRSWALTHASTADCAKSAVNGVVGADGLVTLQTRYTAPPCAGVEGGEVNRIPNIGSALRRAQAAAFERRFSLAFSLD